MDIIKKNIVSVIFGGVALVAIIASFFPLDGMYDDVRKEMKKRKDEYTKADGLLRQPRVMPNVDIYRSETIPLKRFPSEAVVQSGQKLTSQVKKHAQEIMAAALQMNDSAERQGLLVPGVLPLSNDMTRAEFRDKYDELMRNYPVINQQGGPALAGPVRQPGAIVKQVLKATTAPSQGEINAAIQQKQADWTNPALRPPVVEAANVRPEDMMAARAKEEEMRREVLERIPYNMRLERAKAGRIYIDPARGLHYNAKIFEAKARGSYPDNQVDIWWAQLGLWIQRDVVQAINKIQDDAKATTVLNAPIKNLRAMRINEAFLTNQGFKTVLARSPMPGTPEAQQPVGAVASDPFRLTSTGRVCNPLYDVVHFSFVLDLDGRYLLPFIDALQHERLICVRQTTVAAVDKAQVYNLGFLYSDREASPDKDDAVVRVSFACEAIFLRDWTRGYMPEEVKRALKIQTDPRGY